MGKYERIRFFEGAKLRFLLGAKTLMRLFWKFIFLIGEFELLSWRNLSVVANS
jgi:hypothetical protein